MEWKEAAVVDDKPYVIELVENARPPRPWTLTLHPDRWVFGTPGGAEPTTLVRDNLRKWVDLEVLANFGMLHVTLGKKLMFQLKPEARAVLNAWIGPPTKQDLISSINKRYGVSSLVMAGVMLLMATPWFMPAWLAPTGADPTAFNFDWVLLIWGGSTLIGWLVSRVAPHRSLFLIDVVIDVGVATWWGYDIATGERAWWLVFMILLMLFGANLSRKKYKRFAGL